MRKKGVLEVLDEALVNDVKEIAEVLERIDQGFYVQPKKKWGRPVLYDDEFHLKERERLKRFRRSDTKV